MPDEDRFARRVMMRVKHDKMHEFLSMIRKELAPRLAKEKGLRRLFLLRSPSNMNEFVSLTLWNSEKDAENYEKSGKFAKNVGEIRDMLEEEPTVSKFHVELRRLGSAVAKKGKRSRRK